MKIKLTILLCLVAVTGWAQPGFLRTPWTTGTVDQADARATGIALNLAAVKQHGSMLLTNFLRMGISNIVMVSGSTSGIGTNAGVLWITNAPPGTGDVTTAQLAVSTNTVTTNLQASINGKVSKLNDTATNLNAQAFIGGTANALTGKSTNGVATLVVNSNGWVIVNGLTNQNLTPALRVNKGADAIAGLDVHGDNTGYLLRIFQPFDESPERPTLYIDNGGFLNMRSATVISGQYTGSGPTYSIVPPSADPLMLGIWADINGPAVQVRSADADSGAYIFSGLNAAGKYVFNIEGWRGALTWGATNAATHIAYDVGLSRVAPGIMEFNNGTNGDRRALHLQRIVAFGDGQGNADDIILSNDNAGITFRGRIGAASGGAYHKLPNGTTRWFSGVNWQTGDGQWEVSQPSGAKFVLDLQDGFAGFNTSAPTNRADVNGHASVRSNLFVGKLAAIGGGNATDINGNLYVTNSTGIDGGSGGFQSLPGATTPTTAPASGGGIAYNEVGDMWRYDVGVGWVKTVSASE